MTDQSISSVCISNARVQAFIAPIVQHPVGYRGGPVLTEPEHQRYRHHRGNAVIDNFIQEGEFNTYLSGDLTYGGALYDHFGHFMAEMVHRIIPSRAVGLPDRYVFVTSVANEHHRSFAHLPSHIRDVLSFLGLNESNVVIISENTVIERLHLVEQAAQHHGDPATWYLRDLAAYSTDKLDELFGDQPRPKRIYVSRSGLPMAGGVLGEAYLEMQLEKAGFTIFHPEQSPFAEQMDHYRKADCIVFTQGSACHGTELLGEGAMNHVVLIPKSIKADYFVRILKPRAQKFQVAGAPRMVGTMHHHPQTRFAFIHLGVSVVDTGTLSHLLGKMGIIVDGLSRTGYGRAAFRDLLVYLEQSGEAPTKKRQVAKLLANFVRLLF